MKILHLAAAVALLSVTEATLVLLGALPPALFYSPGNILFSLAKLAIIAYAGVVFAKEGLGKSALNGAILGFAGTAILCVFSLLGSALLGKTVLGLPLGLNIVVLAIALVAILLGNTVIGALLAAITGFAVRRK